MPASRFDATHAVICHSLVPMDPGTLDTLQAEEFLLVHSAPCSGTNDYMEKTDVNGELVFAAYYNFKVRWSVTADALALSGLADYHPGAGLSTQNLEFLNASRNAFQIGVPGGARRLIYESPKQDPAAGGLVAVSFDVVSMFGLNAGPTAVVPGIPDVGGSLTPEVGGGTHWSDVYSASMVWIRRLVSIIGPDTGLTYASGEDIWFTRPLAETPPVDLSAFLAESYAGAEASAENEIREVFNLTTDSYYRGSSHGAILAQLQSGIPIPPPSGTNVFYGGPGGTQHAWSVTATDAASFFAEFQLPGDSPGYIDGVEVTEIYSIQDATWWLGL